jgi:Zn-dependent peptidase ImmA (M78 family)
MTLPKSVKIFGLKFKVKVTKLNGYLGLCDRLTNTIYIEANQSDKDKLHTLIHEIGHAVFGRVGLCQGISPEIEEVIVENMATAIIENNLIEIKAP